MKIDLFSNEANKIWKSVASETMPSLVQMELDLYKKLLNFFQVGDYYYYIFNFKTLNFDLVSKEIEQVLGYKPEDVSIDFIMDKMHPDDRPWFLSFENKTASFLSNLPANKLMKYKTRYDLRFKDKSGNYLRILHQVAVIQTDETGGIIRTFGVHTDISHLKAEGKPVMSYIGMDGEPSYLNIDVENSYIESNEILTKREKEVLFLLIDGKLSKEIGDILGVSKQTIDKHRSNMLKKNNLSNTAELIGKAISDGWI